MALTRRALLASAAAAMLAPRAALAKTMPGEPFPVSDREQDAVDYKYHRQEAEFASAEAPGTIVVDQKKKFLYLVQGNGQALRFGVSVPKKGHVWSGETVIAKMAKWPVWIPTPDHIARRPDVAKYLNGGFPPGPGNPMGARALYLYKDNADTSYRIHGTEKPSYIGTKATAGCFGMLNPDVIYLYDQVTLGTRVVVLPL
jgi:lipoprotein-anchoring transpeptidase ErfK/SrfK